MDFGFTQDEEELRIAVRSMLTGPEIQGEVAAVLASGEREPDLRGLYRKLGQLGLLAVNWPREYGGRGASLIAATIVAEELARAGIPDTLHVNTIQIVGLFLLMAGTSEQKARYLPPFARGERFASVLYTEPGSGSDLGSLQATATFDGEAYLINGVKVFSLKSDIAEIALCAARTGEGASKYQGISLFLVDLHAPGVRRSPIPSIANEQFHRVELHDVRVGREALIGLEGEGWPLLAKALAIERTGLDYSLKAERWFEFVVSGLQESAFGDAPTGLGPGGDGSLLEQLGRYGAAVDASRLLAWKVLTRLADGALDETASAVAKYYSSELAREIAMWAPRVHGFGYALHRLGAPAGSVLEAAYREAPGLTLSAGTSEVMLQIIAGSALETTAWEVP